MSEEKLDLILSELKNVNEKLGSLEEGQKNVNERLGSLEEGQKKVNDRLGSLEEGQKKVNDRLGSLEEGQKKVEKEIKSLKMELRETNYKMNDGFELILKKEYELEQKIDRLSSNVRINASRSRNIEERLEYLEERVS